VHIDSHVHVVSPDEDLYPLDPSDFTDAWYREDPCSVERLLELMDEARVDAAVLVQAVSAYRYDNRYCTDAARRFPARCTSVACVDVTAGDVIAVAQDVVEREHARGIRWFAIRDAGVREPRALWDAIAGLRVPVVVTILPDRLEELAATIPAIPTIPLALDHCGFVSFASGIPDALGDLAAFPNLHLKVSSNTLELMAEHGDPADGVAELAARFGVERLIWGSDYSQTHDRPYPALVESGRAAAAKLSVEQRDWFLGGTALKLWPELAR
jgi:predicted TIM-barrel fold metal-dependent hydrolase